MATTRRITSVLFLMVAVIGVSSIASADMVNNIAPDASTSASSEYNTEYTDAKLNDGTKVYGVRGASWVSDNVAPPHWAQLTWADTVQFDEVKLYNTGTGGASFVPYTTYDFQIQTSDDGLSWATVDDVTANTDSIYTFTSASPISVKHLRVYITTPTSDVSTYGQMARITEIEVNGVPEPGTMSLLAIGGLLALRRRRS